MSRKRRRREFDYNENNGDEYNWDDQDDDIYGYGSNNASFGGPPQQQPQQQPNPNPNEEMKYDDADINMDNNHNNNNNNNNNNSVRSRPPILNRNKQQQHIQNNMGPPQNIDNNVNQQQQNVNQQQQDTQQQLKVILDGFHNAMVNRESKMSNDVNNINNILHNKDMELQEMKKQNELIQQQNQLMQQQMHQLNQQMHLLNVNLNNNNQNNNINQQQHYGFNIRSANIDMDKLVKELDTNEVLQLKININIDYLKDEARNNANKIIEEYKLYNNQYNQNEVNKIWWNCYMKERNTLMNDKMKLFKFNKVFHGSYAKKEDKDGNVMNLIDIVRSFIQQIQNTRIPPTLYLDIWFNQILKGDALTYALRKNYKDVNELITDLRLNFETKITFDKIQTIINPYRYDGEELMKYIQRIKNAMENYIFKRKYINTFGRFNELIILPKRIKIYEAILKGINNTEIIKLVLNVINQTKDDYLGILDQKLENIYSFNKLIDAIYTVNYNYNRRDINIGFKLNTNNNNDTNLIVNKYQPRNNNNNNNKYYKKPYKKYYNNKNRTKKYYNNKSRNNYNKNYRSNKNTNTKPKPNLYSRTNTKSNYNNNTNRKCEICTKDGHTGRFCRNKELRRKYVQENNLCSWCLKPGHIAKNCFSRKKRNNNNNDNKKSYYGKRRKERKKLYLIKENKNEEEEEAQSISSSSHGNSSYPEESDIESNISDYEEDEQEDYEYEYEESPPLENTQYLFHFGHKEININNVGKYNIDYYGQDIIDDTEMEPIKLFKNDQNLKDIDKLQVPGKEKLILFKCKVGESNYISFLALGDTGSTISIITPKYLSKIIKIYDQLGDKLIIKQKNKFMVENGGSEDTVFDGNFVELQIFIPGTNITKIIEVFITPQGCDISYGIILGNLDLKLIHYEMVLFTDNKLFIRHDAEIVSHYINEDIWETITGGIDIDKNDKEEKELKQEEVFVCNSGNKNCKYGFDKELESFLQSGEGYDSNGEERCFIYTKGMCNKTNCKRSHRLASKTLQQVYLLENVNDNIELLRKELEKLIKIKRTIITSTRPLLINKLKSNTSDEDI